MNISNDLYESLELFKNPKTKTMRAVLEFMGSFHRWLYGITDAATEAQIYKLLETNSNDTNKPAALFAYQTEIVFKELSNTSAITFKLVDNIKTLRNTISNFIHESLFPNITTILYHCISQY